MSANEKSLEAKILEDLAKTGFPTELMVANTLTSRGYGVLHNPSYEDDVEKISREFDLRAFRSWPAISDTPQWSVSVYLVIECKKSDKPWVFFSSPMNYSPVDWVGDPLPLRTNTQSISNLGEGSQPRISIDRKRLQEVHHYFMLPNRARTYYEPLKGRDYNSVGQLIYTAVMACTKAVLFLSSEKRQTRHLSFFYPLVVFNGQMYEAQIAQNRSLSLSECNYVQLSNRYFHSSQRDSIFANNEVIIDIIREEYVPTYLKIIENEMKSIASIIREAVLKSQEEAPSP